MEQVSKNPNSGSFGYDQSPSDINKIDMAGPDKLIKILIVDDDEDDFLITREYIKNTDSGRFIIDWCYAYNEALAKINRGDYDLYLVDYRLGAKTGLDLLKEAVQSQCDAPIVLLTGEGNQAVDKEAMQIGAADYLI